MKQSKQLEVAEKMDPSPFAYIITIAVCQEKNYDATAFRK